MSVLPSLQTVAVLFQMKLQNTVNHISLCTLLCAVNTVQYRTAYVEVEAELCSFLTSEIDGGEC